MQLLILIDNKLITHIRKNTYRKHHVKHYSCRLMPSYIVDGVIGITYHLQ